MSLKHKTLLSLLVLSGLSLFMITHAQFGMMSGRNFAGSVQYSTSTLADNPEINSSLQQIYSSQGIASQTQINCSKVTDNQFEKLGDAYMGAVLQNEAQHTAMENMMGGEGSASLKQAHINMGRSYLGCWSGYSGAPTFMPMMGGYGIGYGMMGNGVNSYYNLPYGMMGSRGWGGMMGGYYGGYAWIGIITMILIWIVLILGIIALYKWLKKK